MVIRQNYNQEYRDFAKNTLYSMLNTYGSFFFLIIYSFIIARTIVSEEWGYLIISNSIIIIISLFLSFFPPGLATSLNYFLSKFSALNDKLSLKKYTLFSILLVGSISLFTFSLFLLILTILPNFFDFVLKEYSPLLYILSPLIIINNLESIYLSINRALNRFKLIFYLLILKYAINLFSLIFLNIILNNLNPFQIAIINLFSAIIPFLANTLFILIKNQRLKIDNIDHISLKSFIKKTFKYGSIIKIGQFFSEIWNEFKVQMIGIFSSSSLVTGYSISKNYSMISSNMALTFSSPLTVSFTKLYFQNQKSKITKLYNYMLVFSLLLLLLITGGLFFLVDFFLILIFSESYLIYGNILRISLFTIIFLGIGSPFESYMLALNKAKYILFYRFLAFIIRVPLFSILIIFFSLEISIVGIVISNLIISMVAIYLTTRFGEISINKKKILLLFIDFFLALFSILMLQSLIFSQLKENFSDKIIFSNYLNIFSTIGFYFLFLFLVIYSRIFVKSDVENLDNYINSDIKSHKLIRKSLYLLKKLVRS